MSAGDQETDTAGLKTPARNRWRWAAGLSISLAALALALWGVRPDRIVYHLGLFNYALLIPAACTVVLGLLARARGWHLLLGGRVPFGRAFFAMNEGYLVNTALPLRLGELARAYLVSRGQAVGAAEALSAVMVERLLDTFIGLSGLILALPQVVAPSWARNVAWLAGGALFLALTVLAVMVFNRRLMRRLLQRLPGRGEAGLSGAVSRFLDGLGGLAVSPGRLAHAGLWILLAWVSTWLQCWLLLAAAGELPGIVVLLFTSGVVAFGVAVPFSPGALGVYELSTVAALSVFGYARELALAVAVLAHALVILIPGLFGGWALAREGQTVVGLANKVQGLFRRP